MSADSVHDPAAVIPRPEERPKYTRLIGKVEDPNGATIEIGVDYDSVTVVTYTSSSRSMQLAHLDEGLAEDLAQALVAACWEAGRNAKRMAEETP